MALFDAHSDNIGRFSRGIIVDDDVVRVVLKRLYHAVLDRAHVLL
jgi:hypothetical protein